MTDKNTPIERRTIIKAAAWAAPVVAVAATAPLAAATVVTVSLTTTSTLGGVANNGIVGDITLTAGNFTLTGLPNTTAGFTHIGVTLPTGYTAETLGGVPLAVNTPINAGWTVVSVAADYVELVGPSLTVTSGTSAVAWFDGLKLIGTGATPTNKAVFEYWTDNVAGGESSFPGRR